MGFVVVPRYARAKFSDQRVGKEPVVVQADAVGVLDALSFEIVLCWAASYSKYGA